MTPEQVATPVAASTRTGGQYSLFRVGLGLALVYLFGTFMEAAPHASLPASPPLWSAGLGVLLAIGFAIGWRDRWCALGLLVLWAGMALLADWRFPVLDGVLGLLLIYHLLLSRGKAAPYGALSAYGRVDPGGGWELPAPMLDRAWLLVCVGLLAGAGFVQWVPLAEYSHAPYLFLLVRASVALGLACLVAALWMRALRPMIWICLLGMLCFAGLSDPLHGWDYRMGSAYSARDAKFSYLGPWILLLFLFDPRWIWPRIGTKPELLFYDGECGLCHRAARFLLAEDVGGRAFSMAPLQGPTFASNVSQEQRATLPDSIIILTSAGRLLSNSSAIVHILLAVGGYWRLAGCLLFVIPRPLRDAGYRFIASIRKRVFAQPKSLCPLLPQHLGSRFLP